MVEPPLIRGIGLGKVYGNLVALDDADLSVRAGEVRALIGSNGAGKSTLIKILTGAVMPTAGSVEMAGEPVRLGSPPEMIRRGVACIYQHSNLAPAMPVLDNIFLGRQPTLGFGFVDRKRQRREARELMQRFAIDLDLDATVAALPTVKQKEVEILKALALDAKVILMDEPTGWLAAADVRKLHASIRALKARGVGIVYISHMLDEIFAVCDTMTVMRDGHVIAEVDVADMDRPRLVALMVGDDLAKSSAGASLAKRIPRGNGIVRLRCRGLGKRGLFRDISFDVNAGEIFCITGLIGSKRTELIRSLFGADRFDSGSVEFDGKPAVFRNPSQAIGASIGFVPEDRHRDGLMLGLSVAENLVMSALGRYRRFGLLDRRKMADASRRSVSSLDIQPPDGDKQVRLLSGGNQQKVLIGKWLSLSPRLIILDEPTVGVDVGAKAEIYAMLRAERDRGAAVLVVSSDIEEVMTIADRVAIMVAGKLTAVHDADKVTRAEIIRDIGESAA
ncbi:sugar ABC transporter ATP-binding protein [Mesorhizobium sp. SARCC-RB16n]|uniref:sugar ABC transporter ATP-binding protein n=1 Tax=Mesorhizobium sp. SARCC-RB16n TaxID=2116687 RepID=UPI00166561FC|nr:sugar ABC transporter ATP-binding protein [Mesorhizobium sp. SARCC-RB16n]